MGCTSSRSTNVENRRRDSDSPPLLLGQPGSLDISSRGLRTSSSLPRQRLAAALTFNNPNLRPGDDVHPSIFDIDHDFYNSHDFDADVRYSSRFGRRIIGRPSLLIRRSSSRANHLSTARRHPGPPLGIEFEHSRRDFPAWINISRSNSSNQASGANNNNNNNNNDPGRPENNIDQLRSDLVTLELLFQRLLGQPILSNDGIGSPTSTPVCPPASQHIIDNIPTIKVSNNDFEDNDNNKECCICFLEHKVNDTVSRLPCGHFFHGECINEWLQKRCTCPICRWELETEDQIFEVERLERMKSRRIRVKDHELDRLCIKGLQEMAGKKNVKNRAKLIDTIKGLDNVDIITREKKPKASELNFEKQEEEEERQGSTNITKT